ncbi:hypothetical protein LGL55_00560 [Clostridium tagluense]|uniref:hypothetical protein n=1 Tax=Clostridium tagluense TaxID=360422 RepID=UPI001CF22866|nr:hypothetical protein [Clostridium tagluense]MCB2309605.1 hypothetical protein [Clostridium tagluense]MCB2314865.1 hypothetical protein [Clostridium tagluense]MCB2319714.1 hypothetical protein [Clostridium tagluense]MCB2324199.1 hypothetical protein [Clostridium tagluense]MCB2329050.1 hypothetical protein [Clostridium tagluense]
MDIIKTKGIDTSNHIITNDTKKLDTKNDGTSDASKIKGVTQDLGTDTFVKSTEKDISDLTYKPIKKKLSTEEVKDLKESQENFKTDLIRKFISDTINNQNKLLGKSTESQISEMPKETTDLLTKIFGSLGNAYPEIATTPEGATQAIEEGGAYSVTAVADRIMTMAQSIAGDNPNKIQQMRTAVEEGFSQAGLDFNKATNSNLPQICKDTITEVMKRFDELQRNPSSTNEKVTNNNN